MAKSANRKTKSASERVPEAEPKSRSVLLADLGIIGLQPFEPVLLAALIQEDPILLIGNHGTGKSYILRQLAAALGLTWRHYNASLLNFDDLVGFPVPDSNGGLIYAKTPCSIWEAEVVFFDEISRCRPELQNKLFPIVYERCVQGMPLARLVHRWAAMNPPPGDEETPEYRGSEALDVALADRFAFIVEMPDWRAFSEQEQEAIVQCDSEQLAPAAAARLREFVATGKPLTRTLHEQLRPQLAPYIRVLGNLLAQAGYALSPRRLNMLLRNIAGVHAARLLTEAAPDLSESARLAVQHAFPHPAYGKSVEFVKLVMAHRQAWSAVSKPEHGPMLHILTEPDPIRRAAYAMRASSLPKGEFSTIVADCLAQLPQGAQHALAAELFENGAAGRLVAAVADQCAELYGLVATPQHVHESLAARSVRHCVWQRVVSCLGRLPANGPDTAHATNLLGGLFAGGELGVEADVDRVLTSWQNARQNLKGRA